MKFVLGMLLVLACSVTASADSVWTYTGNSISSPGVVGMPNPCGCAISGTVTLDAAGDATAWDFTDGTHTLTQANSTGLIESHSSSSTVLFSTWEISLSSSNVSFFSGFTGSGFEATDSVLAAGSLYLFEQGNRGKWTETVATPEPGTGVLIACGALLFGLLAASISKSNEAALLAVAEGVR